MSNTFRYCQSQIEDNGKCETQCEHCKEYYAPLENEPTGLGVGGESLKENFIDSNQAKIGEDGSNQAKPNVDRDFMYNWIRKHSGK